MKHLAMLTKLLTKEMSSSGCTNLDVKPEVDSGFLMVGAPEIVGDAPLGLFPDITDAAGNVGRPAPGGVEFAADCRKRKLFF